VTFYVQKDLPLGGIRFGVNRRRGLGAIDDDPALSTGAAGEFLRNGSGTFFFADASPAVVSVIPTASSIRSIPFLASLKPDGTRRGYGFLALLAGGAFFLLLGFAVLTRKGPAGWVEVLLGLGMIATPIVMTAQRRKQLHEQEERERAEREALEARNRKMLADYLAALGRIATDRSEPAFEILTREREALTLPYGIWGATAREAVLRLAFDELARHGVAGATEAVRIIDRASAAAGLSGQDAHTVKAGLYRTVAWHLLAGDRLGVVQEQELRTLADALGLSEDDVSDTGRAIDELGQLRDPGIDVRKLDCAIPLAFREPCVYQTETADGPLFITSRRLVLGTRKPVEVELPKIDELLVDADDGALVIRAEGLKKPLRARVARPITTAAVVELAGEIETRPKGFA
jgi:hypothetical protein